MRRLHKTLDHEVEVLQHQFMCNMVRSGFGEMRFLGANTAEIRTETGECTLVEFDKALIATGPHPYRPRTALSTRPFDKARVFDSDEILELERIPRTMTVIGGGVIGVEYVTTFSALDVPVTLIEARDQILDFVDRAIMEDFIHQIRDRGMTIRLGAKVKTVATGATGVDVGLTDGRRIRSDTLLFAAGRSGNVERLNLSAVGLEPDARGRLKVDPLTFETEAPNIYAAGDVIGFPALASTSMEQGRVAACHAFGVAPPPPPATFPYGIYAVPEISTLGRSEEEVRESGEAYECGIARFRETSRGHIMGVNTGFPKLIFSLKTRRLLGAHILGEGATELIHLGQAVINLVGTVDFFVEKTFDYPTLAEACKVAGLDAWNRMGGGAFA